MCGIVGFTGKRNDIRLSMMLQAIQHRGYDESVTYSHKNIHVGMNRLAIKDLTTGLYPFSFKQLRMVYNGEIYNYRELRKLLENKGFSFKTDCDGEIILPLFFLLGNKAFALLEGMFAIAIINTQSNELVLSRDKFGEKPLYYTQTKTSFIFASEIKALLVNSELSARLNMATLPEYLHHGSIAGDSTLLHNIFKLQSGHCLRLQSINHVSVQPYWQFEYSPHKHSLDSSITEIENRLVKSVTSKLVADVPVGTFLSGGVDSSLVSAIAAKHIPNLHTFSVSFPSFRHENESQHAQLVSRHIGSNHHEIAFDSQACLAILNAVAVNCDEPIVDPAVLPTFVISKEARKYVKVILSGEGADEVFGGYYRYYKFLLKYGVSLLLPKLHQLSHLNSKLTHYSPQTVWTENELRLLLHRDVVVSNGISAQFADIAKSDPLLSLQLSDINHYLRDQLLMKVDKMSMLNNLEIRAPYLDSRLVSYVLNTPPSHRFRFFQNKYILKRIGERYLPPTIVWRPKHGFSVPLASWFRTSLQTPLYDSLDFLSIHHQNLFDKGMLDTIMQDHLSKRVNNSNKLWSLLMLSIWMKGNNVKSE